MINKTYFCKLVLFGLLLVAGLFYSPLSPAQQLDERTYNQIMAAMSLAEEDDIPGAIEGLLRLVDRLDHQPFAQAIVLQQLAAFQINEEQYAVGLQNLRRALTLEEDLPDELTASIRYMTAQVLLIEEQFEDALQQLQIWRTITEQPPKPHGIFLIAYVHFRLEQFAETAANLELIIDLPDRHDRWVDLLFYSYLQNEQDEEAKRVLTEALERDPAKQSWWKYLATIYILQEDYPSGLAGFGYAGVLDELTEREHTEVARMYAYLEVPEKASRSFEEQLESGTVEATIDNYIMLGTFWAMAREHDHAERVLTIAAEESESSRPLRILGQIHLNRLEYGKAEEVLIQALERAEPEEQAQIHYFVGIAAYNNDNIELADRSFRFAAEDEDFEDRAQSWLERVDNLRVEITAETESG